jgi:hypothetical protein
MVDARDVEKGEHSILCFLAGCSVDEDDDEAAQDLSIEERFKQASMLQYRHGHEIS